MTDYPEALIEKVARELFAVENCAKHERPNLEKHWNTRLNDEDRTTYRLLAEGALTVLGFAPFVGSQYWRSAIHVEEHK